MTEQAQPREPRVFEVVSCYDCGYVGNRPNVQENYQEGWEQPWTATFCPECGESAGSWITVREVLDET
jgi:hypothetical protein